MAGDSPTSGQDDLEDLLHEAQLAAGLASPAAPEESGALEQVQEGSAPSRPSANQPPHGAPAARAPIATAGPRARAAQARPPAASNVVDEDIQLLIAQAQQAIASVDQPADPGIGGLAPFELHDLAGAPASGEKATIELLKDVELDLRIELGRTEMYLEDVLKLKRGSVVTLDKLAGDPVDVFVNGRMVARGEVLVLNDNFCVRVTELLAGNEFE